MLALQGDTCTKNKIDLKHIVAVATNKSDEEINEKYKNGENISIKDFTNVQWDAIETDLSKNHSSDKVENAMKILREMEKTVNT